MWSMVGIFLCIGIYFNPVNFSILKKNYLPFSSSKNLSQLYSLINSLTSFSNLISLPVKDETKVTHPDEGNGDSMIWHE